MIKGHSLDSIFGKIKTLLNPFTYSVKFNNIFKFATLDGTLRIVLDYIDTLVEHIITIIDNEYK